jgi:hypothetical protein
MRIAPISFGDCRHRYFTLNGEHANPRFPLSGRQTRSVGNISLTRKRRAANEPAPFFACASGLYVSAETLRAKKATDFPPQCRGDLKVESSLTHKGGCLESGLCDPSRTMTDADHKDSQSPLSAVHSARPQK